MNQKKSAAKNGGKVNNKQNSAAVYTLVVFVGTFFCACLMCVVLIGVFFDIIGTAVSVCGQTHLNAKASKRIPGAKKALGLTRNASRVANICNDVIGDVCGTVSGGIGTALAAVLTTSGGLVGLLIIFNVGRLLDWPEVVRAYLKQHPKTPKE